MADVKRVLERQLSTSWGLLEYHLQRLRDDDLFREPAETHWTMRKVDGRWVADWAEVEPDPVPAPTVAWLTWHIGWWWSTALADLEQREIPRREDVEWPGDAASIVEWFAGIHRAWTVAVAATDRLDEVSMFPWPVEAGLTVADQCAWVNVELMKNGAEIGQALILRRADHQLR
ncbi:DinB family protein [Stackebrandtia soli]|uniref:DinB family protein n=1 Tax=Stackebrandtia soli TaxID=1892856 RepID=UPI0039E8C558